mmetsp:Transcript_10923/g.24704  ORF Transcript_10923/g.24704 Transcript_10923/m.24704 type:complete len:204 (+) Transcript_10923:275-886(+)
MRHLESVSQYLSLTCSVRGRSSLTRAASERQQHAEPSEQLRQPPPQLQQPSAGRQQLGLPAPPVPPQPQLPSPQDLPRSAHAPRPSKASPNEVDSAQTVLAECQGGSEAEVGEFQAEGVRHDVRVLLPRHAQPQPRQPSSRCSMEAANLTHHAAAASPQPKHHRGACSSVVQRRREHCAAYHPQSSIAGIPCRSDVADSCCNY